MADLQGKDFVALVRLSDGDDQTIAAVGQTCERVPAGKHGGTASDALAKLLASGLIGPAPQRAAARQAPFVAAQPADPAPSAAVDEPAPVDDTTKGAV